MSLSPPKPLSLSKSPSIGPAAARAATQDAQIAQLVQQNRTLEHTLTQLRAELRAEVARGDDAVNQIRDRWKAERKEWRDACDAIQEKHRLAHLETRVALEHERGYRLEDRAALITEKTATLLCEYKITLFQAKETELVAQVAVLEEELQSQREEMVDKLTQHEAEVAQLIFRLSDVEARQQESARHISQERKALGTELATLQASSTSGAKQIDRLNLQIETLRTKNSSLETRNKELQHQVDKWQSLEDKGEKEVESLRTGRIELEVRVKELEMNLKESRAMGKKIPKLEASLLETQELVEQRRQDVSEAQAEAVQSQKQAEKLQRQIEKLQATLEAERERVIQNPKSQNSSKLLKKVRSCTPSAIPEEETESPDNDVRAFPSKPRLRSQKPDSVRSNKPGGKDKTKGKGITIDDSEGLPESSKKHREGRKHNKNGIMQTEEGEVEDDEVVNDDVLPTTKRRHRRQEQGSDVEKAPPSMSGKPPSQMGKANDTDVEDESEEEPRNKRTRSKPTSTASGQKQSDVDTGGDHPVKKKKRKLNVIGGSNVFGGPAGFTWDQDDRGNLGIPTVLSPIKEGEPVPARSTSATGSILGGWKMW